MLHKSLRLPARARQQSSRTLTAFGVLATTPLFAACAPQASPATSSAPPPPAVAVSVALARHGPIQQRLTYSGDLVAARQITVLPKVSGQIQDLPVGLGSPVKAGDVLATLDPRTTQTQVQQAQAGLVQAQAKLTSMQAGPRQEDVAAANATLAIQQAKLTSMQAQGRAEDFASAQSALQMQQSKARPHAARWPH